MKPVRTLTTFTSLALGFFIGATLPLAGAHPEDECPAPPPCACPVCPDMDGDGLADTPVCPEPHLQGPFLPEGPHLPSPHQEPVQQEAIKKALDAIEAYEKAEEEMANEDEFPEE